MNTKKVALDTRISSGFGKTDRKNDAKTVTAFSCPRQIQFTH
ncbi:hypothetical protein PCO87_07755 [Pectobacteriaceae bacterium C52]|nr:hypothetical protein PCO87_07755 [Pectobacteriaceae bacterium C52]